MHLRIARTTLLLLILAASGFAADITGIWVGQVEGRNGEMEDVAFRFRVVGDSITGKMFGDEFDLPIEDGTVEGDHVQFTVTATNYYSRSKISYLYTGKLTDSEMELTRERVRTEKEDPPRRRSDRKQTLKLKRLT